MNDNGYVYVLMNPSMKNLIKIGKSTRDPQDRAKELSSTTGVPTPFVVVYDSYFESCTQAEEFVHTFLESKGFRVSKNREFFEIPIKDAIDAVMTARDHFGEFIPEDDSLNDDNPVDEEGVFSLENEDVFLDNLDFEEKTKDPWEEMFEIAETHYYGFGNELQDYDEALNYYIQAIKLGSIESYCQVGIMYSLGEGVRENKKKAFHYFKEGAKKGDIKCYAEMAELFGEQDNIENSLKSWKKYFELTTGEIDFLKGTAYIIFLRINNLKLKYVDKLFPVKNKMIEFISNNLDNLYGTELDYLIPEYEKDIRYVKLNIIDPSEKVKNPKETLISRKKSKWGRLFG